MADVSITSKTVIFEVDDLIVAFGTTHTERGLEKYHHVLAKVVGVGDRDIFAISENGARIFKISMDHCVKIHSIAGDLLAKTEIPHVGDLVLSIVDKYTGLEKKLGLLMEINEIPGKTKTGRLLQGDETENVPFDSLIVVETRGKKKEDR